MRSLEADILVFVSHPVAGVHRIPEAWLDGYAPSGFRLATQSEIRRWHADRDLDPPLHDAPSDFAGSGPSLPAALGLRQPAHGTGPTGGMAMSELSAADGAPARRETITPRAASPSRQSHYPREATADLVC